MKASLTNEKESLILSRKIGITSYICCKNLWTYANSLYISKYLETTSKCKYYNRNQLYFKIHVYLVLNDIILFTNKKKYRWIKLLLTIYREQPKWTIHLYVLLLIIINRFERSTSNYKWWIDDNFARPSSKLLRYTKSCVLHGKLLINMSGKIPPCEQQGHNFSRTNPS